jgi:hypothetical protein
MPTANQSCEVDFAQALLDPSAVFATPEEIFEHDKLSRQQKITLLQQWLYDASSVAVAVEEGMRGDEGLMVQRTLQALHQLIDGVDVERTGPTKQGSLLIDVE